MDHTTKPSSLKMQKGAKGTKGQKVIIVSDPSSTSDDPSDTLVMATSFLQFCTTCEKQIFTPSNSILYCSEACRRKDSSKPLSEAHIETSVPASPSPSTTRPILPPRIPTGASSASSRSSLFSPDPNAKSDLDPTEWKPKTPRLGRTPTTSEAYLYLSRFHQSNPSLHSRSSATLPRSQSTTYMRPIATAGGGGVGEGSRTPSSTSLNTQTPSLSLSRTPTTAASSLSGSADLSIHPMGYAYDFNTRPLPPRRDPSLGGVGRGVGVDLVVPHVAPKVEGKYMDGSVAIMGGLGELFRGGKA